MSDDAFYTEDSGAYIPSDWTRGPWDANAQHAGPPSALLGRAVERLDGGDEFFVARFTVEVVRSITLAPLTIEARLARPGKRVQLAEAVLRQSGEDVALVRAWRIHRDDTGAEAAANQPPPFRGPDDSDALPPMDPWRGPSYFTAVRWRDAVGRSYSRGPSCTWMRMAVPLVLDEAPSPLTRVLVAADSGNGISRELAFESHLFINTELTVHLFREAAGEWICLDARTHIGPHGAGLASTVLYDTAGSIGTGGQTLLVRRR